MNVPSILLGACIASLVWALVMMRYVERDIGDSEKHLSLMKDYFDTQQRRNEAEDKYIEAIHESVKAVIKCDREIIDFDKKFKTDVLNLLEKWGHII